MIGQKKLIDKLERYTELPRFLIFNGPKGCGKKTLAKEIAKKFEYQLILIGNKIDEIRDMISIANEYDTPIIFFIDEANKMSLGAENTLLKITEEAPNNIHIIIGVENKDLLLPTIISRGEVFNFQNYTAEEHKQFILDNNLLSENLINDFVFDFLPDVYPNLSYYSLLGVLEASEYWNTFINGFIEDLRSRNFAKCYSVVDKLKIKDDQQGYDLNQFIYCLRQSFNHRLLYYVNNKYMNNYKLFLSCIQVLTKAQKMLINNLFNKSYIIDMLIIDLKKVFA